jgi:hypothetical protein
MKPLTGGCLCGAVRFAIDGAPLRVGLCHCMDCRKHSGAVFLAAAIFSETAVAIEGQTASYQGRHFCPRCGGSVYSRTGGEIEINLGALDAPNQFVPRYELWMTRREAWLPTLPATAHFAHNRAEDGEAAS